MASVLSSLALQIKFCAFKVFQGERNEVITKYAVYLAIYFKLLESIYSKDCGKTWKYATKVEAKREM
jgi:hypothetical protein